MSLSRTLKNRQEDPHALTVTIPDYSLSYANKSQANEVATRICCQGILYHSMYAKHSWGWKQIFGEAFEQYLSIQKKYCEKKSWKIFQESRKRWQNSAKANSCCPVKYGKLSRILFSAIIECTWHYWKQEKKNQEIIALLCEQLHICTHTAGLWETESCLHLPLLQIVTVAEDNTTSLCTKASLDNLTLLLNFKTLCKHSNV